MPCNKPFIDQASSVEMAGHWPIGIGPLALVHKNAKRELGQYPAILTSRLVNNIYIFSVEVLGSFRHDKGNAKENIT